MDDDTCLHCGRVEYKHGGEPNEAVEACWRPTTYQSAREYREAVETDLFRRMMLVEVVEAVAKACPLPPNIIIAILAVTSLAVQQAHVKEQGT